MATVPKLSNRTILSDELLVHSSKTETLMRNTQNLLVFIQILRSSLAITELAFFAPLPKKTSLPAQASVNSHDFGFGLAELRVLSRSFAAQTQLGQHDRRRLRRLHSHKLKLRSS